MMDATVKQKDDVTMRKTEAKRTVGAGRIALSALLSLVVAMGIGRFAFTPQVPLMIADGQLTLSSASP